MTLTRRAVLAAAMLPVAGAHAGPPRRIAVVDWGLASTLCGLDVVPAGVSEIDLYNRWVADPRLPAGVRDIGLRTEPNMEVLVALAPDLILTTPFSESVRPMLERIAPTRAFTTFGPGGEPLARASAITRDLGRLLDVAPRAEALLARVDAAFEDAARRVAAADERPLLLVSFADTRHARVYGANSLFGNVLARLGLANVWDRPTNDWGFSLATIEDLAAHPEARLFYIDPTPPEVLLSLAGDGLLAHLPVVRAGRARRLASAWAFGDVMAAERFAVLLAGAVADRRPPHGG
ncbi:MAG: ABC transporter substrate-binding protein [Microvirga sp.]